MPSADGVNCYEKKCTADAQCEALDINSYCHALSSVLSRCECAPHFEISSVQKRCVLQESFSKLGETCGKCGNNAVCQNRKCICIDGNKAEKNGFNCNQVSCATNADCLREFIVNMACNTTLSQCYHLKEHKDKKSFGSKAVLAIFAPFLLFGTFLFL